MIIVHTHHHYWPVAGGIENAIKYLAEEQAKLGHEVHIVTGTYGAQKRPREEEINGVHVHRIKAWRLGYPDLTIPRETPRELLKRADVIHAHSQNSLFSVRIAQEAHELGVKVAIHYMAVDTLQTHPNPAIRLLGPIYARRNLEMAKEIADIHLARSKRDVEKLRKYGIQAHYLPDAIPKHYLTKPKADPEEFRRKYGITQDKLFIYIGRIHKLKGPHVLVKALPYLSNDIAIIMAGPDNGYLKQTLELANKLHVKDRLYYLGYVDEDTKINAIDASTALVLPSTTDYVEVYPMTITEAWAREKPVIATNVGGIPYRVTHGINGLIIPPNNPQELAKAIQQLANNPEKTQQMGKEGKKEIKTWDEIAKETIKIYNTTNNP
ncbi:glycosyltransferase family 4 protein [Caldivirga maquilingensis]|uniref:Glycosyl transferase group 1 n=1 Tax=Caldivirga maquilingensis (strain ATCC 700844 / DSM 13496 / JCM 10307 / IC-167) TaxID=397948 RepID=A8M951_CALMQ|nr:glycosyltransferase family 4 protein [Caldivirga maquilingensis]ABW02270.1 glycosyl transferase group 1 [Caldivirga maquilingensis IC-167]